MKNNTLPKNFDLEYYLEIYPAEKDIHIEHNMFLISLT
jgi:hypothetical protein